MRADDPVCGSCGVAKQEWSAAVTVCIVWMPGLDRPYPLIPAEEYRYCRACRAAVYFVDKAIAGHPRLCAMPRKWSRAVIVTDDGRGQELKRKNLFPEASA